ncbi:MAG: hypothetical protein OJF47_001345 [Nitrospira sp.]|jgi:hypothetical protein|nr:MAG: hypothetical protein OJF47_001345 [Nitrospira sp.]
MDEAGWKRLMAKIRENNVVPLIGSRLLVGADGRTSLQAQVITHLLQNYGERSEGIALPPFREINEVVSRLKKKINPVDLCDDIRSAIHAVINAEDFRVPEPISQLAAITSFRFFVTLTPDDLLARCVKQQRRCPVNEIIHSLDPVERDGTDLPSDWGTRHGEVNVLYLFGKAHAESTFAIHDEDVLEYAHKVITDGRLTLKRILGVLHGKSLLLIGCNFPEWLSRFFLRAINRSRLSEKYRRSWLIEQLKQEESFTRFLDSYGTDTEVLSDLSPVEFVAELYRRWMNEHGTVAQEPVPSTEESVPGGTMFFISYSRQTDQAQAESLRQSLLNLGISENEIWFDRHSIEPGEDFQQRIFNGIGSCRYFLPLLSRSCNDREEAFVFKEWERADDRLPINRDFLFPIIVDKDFNPGLYTAPIVPIWRDKRRIDFAHAPDGVPDERLKKKLKQLIQDSRWESKAT